jgi:hypothetical protein
MRAVGYRRSKVQSTPSTRGLPFPSQVAQIEQWTLCPLLFAACLSDLESDLECNKTQPILLDLWKIWKDPASDWARRKSLADCDFGYEMRKRDLEL